ncbi:RNA ligase [Candidatus Micrarchaeota archaeon]|nr:RNA ligase [Candidatus Micrarchaeota archaeon]
MEISKSILEAARKKGKIIDYKEEINYSRFREDFRFISRGTVLIGERIIHGFPHIKRIFTLEKGLAKNMSEEFYAEEKIDGFNLRVAKVGKKVFAFSRGGFVDPFSTEKARDLNLDQFFRDYPDYILCGEMIGNTPYTTPAKEFDVRFLIFDFDSGSGQYVEQSTKYSLIKKYDLNSVPQLGKFSQSNLTSLKNLLLNTNKSKKEGLVLKSIDRKQIVKYVVPNADIEDIGKAANSLFDMPTGYFIQRILRSAVFIKDFGLDRKKYSQLLGEAFYDKLTVQLSKIEEDGIYDEFEVLIKSPKTWDGILKHMSKEVKIEVLFKREEKNGSRIRFRKIYKKTTKKLREFLSGKGIED